MNAMGARPTRVQARVQERVRVWEEGDARLTNGVLCVLGLLLVVLAHQFVAEIAHYNIGHANVSMLSVLVYLGAVIMVRTQPINRATLGIVVGFAVPMYAMTYLTDPYLSSDIYRYVWDGIVQHAHVNPYRYVPGNAALTFLREPNQEIFDNINRRDYAPTIYPPAAQMIFWFATYFAPTVEAMKLLMLAFVGLTGAALAGLLQRLERPKAEVLLLLWCPLVVWEVGNAGHVDAAICGFLALALLFRWRNQPVWTGLFLGCAVMTKFYPLVLVPALYQRRDWKMPATLATVCIAGYAVYASVGWRVFGFLTGYTKEEGIDSGSRFFLLDYVHTLPGLARVPTGAFLVLCVLILGGLAFWAWRDATVETMPTWDQKGGKGERVPAFMRTAAMLAFAMMLLFSPHYAWYNLWLVPLLVLVPRLPLITYVLVFFFGYTTKYAAPGPQMFFLNKCLYAAVLGAFALEWAFDRWGVWKRICSRTRFGARMGANTFAEIEEGVATL